MAIEQDQHYVVIYDQGDCQKQFILVREDGSKVNSGHTLEGIMSVSKECYGLDESGVSTDVPDDVMERVRASNTPGRHIYTLSEHENMLPFLGQKLQKYL